MCEANKDDKPKSLQIFDKLSMITKIHRIKF